MEEAPWPLEGHEEFKGGVSPRKECNRLENMRQVQLRKSAGDNISKLFMFCIPIGREFFFLQRNSLSLARRK